MKRRDFVKGAGAVTVLVAGGGVWRAHDRGVWSVVEGAAYEPWCSWRTDAEEGALALVRAGILASNPHNTQAWLFRVTDWPVDLYADLRRHLGTFDPYRREMYLGLGCALENMMLAARAAGFAPTLALVPGTLAPPPAGADPVLAARIDLAPAEPQPPELYAVIRVRHTNRGPYARERAIPDRALTDFREQTADEEAVEVVLVSEAEAGARLGDLVVASTEAIIADATMVHDSERWYRRSRAEIERHRDGTRLRVNPGARPLRPRADAPRRPGVAVHAPAGDGARPRHAATEPARRVGGS
jgi:hypothetical protein